jgi:hypothetical protein
MAARTPILPPASEEIRTLLYDRNGEPILQVSASKQIIQDPVRGMIAQTLNSSIELSCGMQWHPGLLNGPQAVLIGVCEICRHPPYRFPRRERPTHGIVSLQAACRCVCGLLVCPRHAMQCDDGRWRCPRCASRYRLGRFFLGLFFHIEEDD